MKRLKSLFAMVAMAVLFGPGLVLAQGRGNGGAYNDPEAMAKRQTDMMKTQLQLTEEQVPKVEQINLETSKKMVEARSQNQGDPSSMRPKMMEIMNGRDAQLKEVLTSEQYDKWVKYRAERQANRGGRQGGPRGNNPR